MPAEWCPVFNTIQPYSYTGALSRGTSMRYSDGAVQSRDVIGGLESQ